MTSGLVVGLGGAVGVIIAGARSAVGTLVVSDRPARGLEPREGRHLRP